MTAQKILRHVGRITNTGSDVVVIFNEIPDNEDCALVVVPSALPPKYSDSLVDLINSEAQRTTDLPTLLSRKLFPTGERMLEALHNNRYLRAVPNEEIIMLVTKHDTMPLKDIVAAMRAQKAGKTEAQMAEEALVKSVTKAPLETVTTADVVSLQELSAEDQAKNLMMQASLLEADVNNLKEKAYNLDPSLKTKKRGRPKKAD